MKGVLKNCLFENYPKMFEHLNDITKQFASVYSGNYIIKNSIFAVMENYARKKEISMEILRFPIHDEELWAMTFLKRGTIFVCVNSKLALCKQFFAAAHELYHIYCYVENSDQSYIKNGSMLDSDTANEREITDEDVEANAFAGLLLMPDRMLVDQTKLFGININNIDINSVLSLMDIFAIPYKAVILRLYESKCITYHKAEELLKAKTEDVANRIKLTGKAKLWQMDGAGTESFGTLLEKADYNISHEFLTDTRKKDDLKYLDKLKKELGMD